MLSKTFIERPILSNVIGIIIVLIGAVSIFGLPVAQYPQMTPPTIQVTTNWPGANAKLIQQLVGSNIENQVNGVQGMLYMQSFSTDAGTYQLTVTFAVGTDPDMAQVDVQNRVAIALPMLPQAVQKQGVTTQTQSTAILQFVTVTSKDNSRDALFLSNFANLQMQQRLARIPGVAAANVFGVGNYSMRVWLNPELMLERNLTPAEVMQAINKQNVLLSAGQIGAPPVPDGQAFQFTVNVASAMDTPEQFGAIVLKESDGQLTRLRDVARLEMGSQNYNQFFQLGNQPAGGIAIYQLPDANALQVAQAVRDEMEKISKSFPADIEWGIPFDTTSFVTASIDEVYVTLYEAGLLVLLVILVFLQNWRITLVPAVTIPVTIIGAFAGMAALGFSINLLTLFAIVVVIGIVVDDSIVVVEGVAKKVEAGMKPKDAAIAAMGELMTPIIGITLVLMAVFLPASFISGITGQMYRQFALVIAITALLSGIAAISLSPAQAGEFIKAPKKNETPKPKNRFARAFDKGFDAVSTRYAKLMHGLVAHSTTTALIGVVIIGASIYGLTRVPTGFIPNEDQGYLIVTMELPSGASLQRTNSAAQEVRKVIEAVPGVQDVVTIGGVSVLDNNNTDPSAGAMYVILKPWDERGKAKGEDLRSIYQRMSAGLQEVQSASARVVLPPAIPGLGMSGGFNLQLLLTDGSNSFDKLADATDQFIERVNKLPEVMMAFTTFNNDVPQLELTFNPAAAETLGVNIGDAYDALQSYFGSSYVNQFFKFGQTYQVYVQADGKYRTDINQIQKLYVKNRSGNMVPLGSFVEITQTSGPSIASQYNLFPTASVNGAAAPGFSSGQVLAAITQLANESLPEGIGYEWTAMSYQEQLVGNTQILVFALSILLVYLVLAAQYESWAAPIAVLSAVPLALSGIVIALLSVGMDNNIYVQIGLVLMIALSAKNAILIVEVALEAVQKGMTYTEAALHASHERFRPIVMTSIAFILGVVPLLTATGAGANSRFSIGITVFSGMIASTTLAVAIVPIFFVKIMEFFHKNKKTEDDEQVESSASELS
ncbi:efflux RND transporter permease subunit [Orrella daihaiensis]|uniref:Efflux pump membrane transporter n=1 Tax=Orrella daihaiensis TaxID=2782176 RepID=A0ABY4AHF6_9BURK|nr:efflux RND transporter permease subunit [Orrella daihaiensis]UOD49723.1 efflux RND transporter permease subunit [Orrella daihaiensis]